MGTEVETRCGVPMGDDGEIVCDRPEGHPRKHLALVPCTSCSWPCGKSDVVEWK